LTSVFRLILDILIGGLLFSLARGGLDQIVADEKSPAGRR